MKLLKKIEMRQLIILVVIVILNSSCSKGADDEVIPKENIKLLKEIIYEWGSPSDFYYENDVLLKSKILNNTLYELYEYNDNGKINLITQYKDVNDFPNNSEEVDFNDENNFNDYEYYTEYNWLNENSFIIGDKQYNFDENGLVQSIDCTNFDDCSTVNIYYLKNQIDKVIYNEGTQYQSVYTFEFDQGINPMNILFRKYGFVDPINIGVFDFFFDFYYINNATKIYRDGELVYRANYQYNLDNYPIGVSYERISNGETGSCVFTYQE